MFRAMKSPRKNLQSGGSLLAFAVVAGAVGGVMAGEASIGILAGFAVGLLLLLAVWLVDRSR